MKLNFVKREQLKQKPQDENKLGFGQIFTDYMLVMRYNEQKGGWYEANIEPFDDFKLSPAALVLHYAQTVFEGMKAYKREDGKINMFRPWDNVERLGISADRICMAKFDNEFVLNAIYELIKTEQDWIPSAPGTSLYIRPTYIGIDPFLGVKAASEYLLYVILTIAVESNYVRAVKGGTGYTKAGGNYAASLLAGEEAHKKGYSQVLWLDGKENKYIEEVGAMNIFFKVDGKVITPPLEGSILPGITRRSIIELVKEMGIEVVERQISIDEIYEASKSGKLEEVFGTGTAAVVSPVKELIWEDKTITVGSGEMGVLTSKLYDTLTGIQYGKIEDTHGWTITL